MIEGLRNVGASARTAGRSVIRASEGGSAFSVPAEGGEAAAVAGGSPAAAPAALDAMLALQDVAMAETGEREARRHGQLMLGALAALQRALLAGGVDAALLARLQGLIDDMPRSLDPTLRQALAAVALRGRIELARRQPDLVTSR